MKKDYLVGEVDSKWFDVLIRQNRLLEEIEGGLSDNYVFDFEGMRYGRVRRKYCFIIGEYRNEWGNAYVAWLSDNDNKLDKFIDLKEKFLDKEEYPALDHILFKNSKQIEKEKLEKWFSQFGK